MYDAENKRMLPISDELAAKFADSNAELTESEKIRREWTQFSEGDLVRVKGIVMRVHEIGESRLVLKFQ